MARLTRKRQSSHSVTISGSSSDHHVQKGPFFPHPLNVLIDSSKGEVTVRSTGKDGKDEVKTEHLNLPPDLANGMVPLVIENMQPDTPQATLSMLVITPSPRVVKLVISRQGEDPFSVVGTSHQGIRYQIKIEIGGVAGVVAPLIGKQPPDIQLWIVGGQAPTFLKKKVRHSRDGPILTIELAKPVWPGQNAGKVSRAGPKCALPCRIVRLPIMDEDWQSARRTTVNFITWGAYACTD